jgi:hypothetical protein
VRLLHQLLHLLVLSWLTASMLLSSLGLFSPTAWHNWWPQLLATHMLKVMRTTRMMKKRASLGPWHLQPMHMALTEANTATTR